MVDAKLIDQLLELEIRENNGFRRIYFLLIVHHDSNSHFDKYHFDNHLLLLDQILS
jgi:hypothetical protein